MNEYYDDRLGFTVRTYLTGPIYLRCQIGTYGLVHRHCEPIGRTLPEGYSMDVRIFNVRAFGQTFETAKLKL